LVSIHLPSFLPEEEPVARLSSQYLDRLLEGNRTEAYRLINRAIENGMSIEKIYLEIFQPVQYEIGRLWQTRQISVAQEHLATAITQFVMARLYPMIFKPTEQPNRMVVTCIEEELHEIGARMVADVCELRGWQTYYLGGNIPNKSVIDIVKKLDAQVLGISITMGYHINKVIDLIQNVRALNLPVKIMVGGALFNMDLALWQKAGADGYAPNAALAVTTANQMVEQGRS
jgi:methanogenic corrinoid protein MtbC1